MFVCIGRYSMENATSLMPILGDSEAEQRIAPAAHFQQLGNYQVH